MEHTHSGGCLCQAIRYVASGAPLSTNICFCTQCQRQTGAALPAFATYPVAQLELMRGTLQSYRATERATRQFCGVCGSTLFWREDDKNEIDVFLGTFDEPDRLPHPAYAIWTAHRVPWLEDIPGVTSYLQQRTP